MKNNASGFTAIEVILIVIAISILAAIVIPRFMVNTRMARVQACEMNRAIINTQVESYYQFEATWPMDTLDDIKINPRYFPDGIPTCPLDESSYQLIASPHHRVSGHREGAGTHVF